MDNKLITGGRIMKGYIRAQSIVFGDFSNYSIDPKSIYELMGKMEEFEVIPNVKDEVQIQITENTPKQRVVKRIELISSKEGLIIIISQNNIIIDATPRVDLNSQSSEINIEKFIKNTKKILDILFRIMQVNANRASLITTYLDENDVSEQYKAHTNANEFFAGKDVFEWNTRSVVREKIKEINNEEINIVLNISRVKGSLGSSLPNYNDYFFDGILKEIDINTIPENVIDRIDSSYIEKFYDIALLKKGDIERGGSCSE